MQVSLGGVEVDQGNPILRRVNVIVPGAAMPCVLVVPAGQHRSQDLVLLPALV